MNSSTKSALRSTLQKESESLEARLPEQPVVVEPAPAVVEVALVPEVEAAPAPTVAPLAEAPALAAPAPVKTAAKPAVKRPGKAVNPTAVKKAAAKKVAKPAEAAPLPAAAEVPAKAGAAKAKPVRTEKAVKAEKPAKVEKVLKAERPVKVVKEEKAAKPAKAPKAIREKVVRDSFSMPKSEHAQLKLLREALAKAGRICTKSELLRAGVQLLLKETTVNTRALVERLVVVPKGKSAK